MKHQNAKLISLLLVASMALALTSCGGGNTENTTTAANSTTTAVTTTTPTSAYTNVETDYQIESVDSFKVDYGTSKEDVIAQLPSELTVYVPTSAPTESTTLFSENFSSAESFAENWTLCDPDNVTEIGGGKFATTAGSTNIKAYITDAEWTNAGTEVYANYAIKAVVRGTADTPSNNFGIIFRASEVTGDGPDSYNGLYVGIGDSDGSLCVGSAQNNWTSIANIDIDYAPNTDYTLEVLVFQNAFIVKVNGETLYSGKTGTFVNGTVGLRTYNQLFEASELSVRTLTAADIAEFGEDTDFVEAKLLPVSWDCFDYDPNTAKKYGFFGTVTEGLPEGTQAQVKVSVTVLKEGA
ncbi:MAG: hypothetical protein ACI3YK_05780 [Eubacteriales bacterium]